MAESIYFTGPLRSKISEDLYLTSKSKRTHDGFLREIRKLSDHYQTAPDEISEDQMRRYFLHLKNDSMAPTTPQDAMKKIRRQRSSGLFPPVGAHFIVGPVPTGQNPLGHINRNAGILSGHALFGLRPASAISD